MSNQLNSIKGSLLYHYHEKVYLANDGGLWLSSSQGIWLDELAGRFDRLYLLNFQTFKKTKKHDYQLRQPNVEWINLGVNEGYVGFFRKRRRIEFQCRKWSGKVDHLLIRGFTQFQSRVWQRIKVRKSKSFILVRSLKQPRLLSWLKPLSWIAYATNKLQENRFLKIRESADHLFTNSKEVQNELRQVSGRIVKLSTTNVLKARDFQSFDFNSWGSEFNLLFVGRISALKGFNELIQAFCDLQTQNKDIEVFLHVAGDGEATFVKEMKDKLKAMGLLDQVCFHGRVSFGEELFRLYRGAHAFVLPSYTEGFPRAVWEAALFATPIVVTKVGGIPAQIDDRKHALLVPPRDGVALFEALDEMISNTEASALRAKNAYELALANTLEAGVNILEQEIKHT